MTLLRRTRLGRRILIQLVKRSPIDLRPVLNIQPALNAAAVAQIVSAYSRSDVLPPAVRDARLDHMLNALLELRLPDFDLPCWSYHFDGETRVDFYGRSTPNTIATSFAGQALVDAFEQTTNPDLLELAAGTGDFFLRHIELTETPYGAFFGYWPGNRTPIHNASMLAAALLVRLAKKTGRLDFEDAAMRALRYCLSHQRPDGSWPYGEQPGLRWVDGFHTGYVLEALLTFASCGAGSETHEALRSGLAFYSRHLFLADGTPKYYRDRPFPIDAQSAAQGIQTFSLAARLDSSHLRRAWRVFDFTCRRMRRRDGAFLFQRRRLWKNMAPHIRWVQAPMFLALTNLRQNAHPAATASQAVQ